MLQKYETVRAKSLEKIKQRNAHDRVQILVGTATCGLASGAQEVIEAFRETLDEQGIDADIRPVGCAGLCHSEVLVDIIRPGCPRIRYGHVTPEKANDLVKDYLVGGNPRPDLALGKIDGEGDFRDIPDFNDDPAQAEQQKVILKNCGDINPEDIDEYIAGDGYHALAIALESKPEDIIARITASGLRGRGGAGFPVGRKWDSCLKLAGPKYVICNADEGDPGAFMDRSVLEGDPHAVLEGMAIAACTIGADTGYLYVRAEYPLAVSRLRKAISQARERNLLGDDILGSGFNFDLKIFQGAGAFVCGESTALVMSIEGGRGMPKPLPRPRTTEVGLHDRPTLLNNVKTFAFVPRILLNGTAWFNSIGSENSKGTAVFALTGKIRRSGLVEVPMGIALRKIIYEIGGGIVDGKKFKAVQIGGPSGGCLPERLLDLPVDFDSLLDAGAMMGSGGMVVLDEDSCMVDVARYFLGFTVYESCGQCVPCREGTKQMLRILTDICAGRGKEGDIELLELLAETITRTSICGLGKTASNPVLSTIKYFRDEYEAHIREKRCPALVCKDLITYHINEEKCRGCGICLRACPVGAISGEKKEPHAIDTDLCTRCGICMDVCPDKFSAVEIISGR
ncbi:MAG: NADH-quinone oxidoreductase subunit NuoF [Firmicutes bacterium]|jgi:NADH:ubiquinone oxidoreductase subunit F (NADH-binding)/(2Fe-2S) ferredoxin|nr:NADH-quinone oxidoreductase subunit NuoF [Bacillota bacterium]